VVSDLYHPFDLVSCLLVIIPSDAVSFVAVQADPSVAAKSSSKAGHLKCHQCGINVEQEKIRSHVGGHILQAKFNVHESGLLEKVSTSFGSVLFNIDTDASHV